MIVLDEQLLGRNIETEISRWYQGTVQFITDLRPSTVIKDDAIPEILRRQNQPTFVTINERDFWRKAEIDSRFCMVCFALSDARSRVIPERLRALLRRSEFRTKASRMGKVVRVTENEISYYAFDDQKLRKI